MRVPKARLPIVDVRHVNVHFGRCVLQAVRDQDGERVPGCSLEVELLTEYDLAQRADGKVGGFVRI